MVKLSAIKNIKFPIKLSILSKEYNQLINKPMILQNKLLKSIIKENKNTLYGKKYNFSKIKTFKDYQEQVPIVKYKKIKKYIEKIHKGEQNILTKEKVIFLGTTSGSSGAPKLIPVTIKRKKTFRKELSLWAYFSLKQLPQLWKGKTLHLIGGEPRTISRKSVPHGSINKFLSSYTPKAFRNKVVIKQSTWNVPDYESRLRMIAKEALKTQSINHLGFPYPIEMTFLFKYIQKHWNSLLQELTLEGKTRTVKRLRKINNKKPINIWPKLAAIHMIKTADQDIYLKQLFQTIGKKLIIKDLGINATESRLTFDLKSEGIAGFLAANVTLFEFQEKTKDGFKDPVLLDKLKKGKTYRVIITTVDGLYRYDIGDLIKVIRYEKKLPIVQFAGRDKHLNCCGENTPHNLLIFAANKTFRSKAIKTYTVMPNKNYYEVYVEFEKNPNASQIKAMIKVFDETLQNNNKEYKLLRKKGKLKTTKLNILKQGTFEKIYTNRIWKKGETKAISVTTDKAFKKLLETK